jgi:hypothetical protein
MKFSKGERRKIILKLKKKNISHSWIGHIIRHSKFAVNILEGAISGKKTVGRPRLQCLKQVARNTEADSCTAMKRMAFNNFSWKAANQ